MSNYEERDGWTPGDLESAEIIAAEEVSTKIFGDTAVGYGLYSSVRPDGILAPADTSEHEEPEQQVEI